MVEEARRFPSSYRDCFKGHNQLTVFFVSFVTKSYNLFFISELWSVTVI